jgi:hypothetical protein
MRTLLRGSFIGGSVLAILVVFTPIQPAESESASGAGCFVCGSYSGTKPPPYCIGGQTEGMTVCFNPCESTYYDCAVV